MRRSLSVYVTHSKAKASSCMSTAGPPSFRWDRIAEIPGTIVLSQRTVVHWGDFSMIEATLSLLEQAKLYGTFDRFVLLSAVVIRLSRWIL
ncbi:beta-1,6-N-acetylglucosaminyltransferase [Alloacidobacterium sp.]|uniref:beta-1,6-N-acetylglucosaminyltransferase n=1 Tax=Alloacidobacterium sp. TaxID=2951999 RepID=UPI002D5BA6BB|nr:beta-1,6-N-acetylglucosaminyltransferase [Alloacidobacterium sp.]HYK36962.1 beta-1,6-N-acetylglucosaminyltransferase [Alloacidobacterium sp.]